MILICNYEELNALRCGGRALLEENPSTGTVAAPSATRVAVESLLERLRGDISLSTLGEQVEMERAVRSVVEHLRVEMDQSVVATHPAAEQSVAAYFDFAHALAVLGRVREIGQEMSALVEVMTDGALDEEAIRLFFFPD